jgi:hypothetical protein
LEKVAAGTFSYSSFVCGRQKGATFAGLAIPGIARAALRRYSLAHASRHPFPQLRWT